MGAMPKGQLGASNSSFRAELGQRFGSDRFVMPILEADRILLGLNALVQVLGNLTRKTGVESVERRFSISLSLGLDHGFSDSLIGPFLEQGGFDHVPVLEAIGPNILTAGQLGEAVNLAALS